MAFLNVNHDPRRRILSPLLEEEDEHGFDKPPSLEDYLPDDARAVLASAGDQTSDGSDVDQSHKEVSNEEITLNVGLSEDVFFEDNLSEEEYLSEDSMSVDSGASDFDTDLEIDEETWLNPNKTDHDTTGKTKYMKICDEMGINPVSCFVKNLQNKELKLRFHGLGPQGIKAISRPLETNTNVEILNLEGNGIDNQGAKCICRVLRENLFLTEVVLSENKIATEGAIALCQFLKGNRNLKKVDLTGNVIGDAAGQSFYEVLKGNPVLKELLLANNQFEEGAAKAFKDALQDNEHLELLDLSWNHFKTRGSIAISEGLQENVGLKRFKFAKAGLAKDGSAAMALALKNNRTLLELDISFNRISMEGAHSIASGVKENDVLQVLKIGNNPFDSDGAQVIIEAIDLNECSAIKHLDFSNIMVKIEFDKIQQRLKKERDMVIVNEGVLPEIHPKNGTYARLSAFRRDPIETFKKYAEFSGVKLTDIFNSGDHVRINASEFKTLVKGSGIEIPDEQLTVLTRTLEENGSINYWKILDGEVAGLSENMGRNLSVSDSDRPESREKSAKGKLRKKSEESDQNTERQTKSAKQKNRKKEKKKK